MLDRSFIEEEIICNIERINSSYPVFYYTTVHESFDRIITIMNEYTDKQLEYLSKNVDDCTLFMFLYVMYQFKYSSYRLDRDFVVKLAIEQIVDNAKNCDAVDDKVNSFTLAYNFRLIDRELYSLTDDPIFNDIMNKLKTNILTGAKYDKLCHILSGYNYFDRLNVNLDKLRKTVFSNLNMINYSVNIPNYYYIRGFGEKTWSKIGDVLNKYDTDFSAEDLYSVRLLYQLNVSLDDIENLVDVKQTYKCEFIDRSGEIEKVTSFIIEILSNNEDDATYRIYESDYKLLPLDSNLVINCFKKAINKKK